jgi:hypothetical protein
MDFSAAHVDYVIVSYALSGLCLIGLCLYIFARDRSLANQVKSLSESPKP